MIVRDIDSQDLTALAAIHAASFPRPWPAGELGTMAARPGAVALLAALDDEQPPCGFILCWRTLDEAEMLTLAVDPAARARGVGHRLVEEAALRCAADGAASLWLEVAEDNAPALALYRRAGFRQAGRRRAYYARPAPEPPADALVLQRRLTGTL